LELGIVLHAYNPRYLRGRGRRIVGPRSGCGKYKILSEKQTKSKRDQVVEHLEALNLILNTFKKKKEKKGAGFGFYCCFVLLIKYFYTLFSFELFLETVMNVPCVLDNL
jgi:hypothetical protein